jgi:hypothetical protein
MSDHRSVPWDPTSVVRSISSRDASQFALGDDKSMYLLASNEILNVDSKDHAQRVEVSGISLQPYALAYHDHVLFVAEGAPNEPRINLIGMPCGKLLGSFALPANLRPDKLVYSDPLLYGMNYNSKSLFQAKVKVPNAPTGMWSPCAVGQPGPVLTDLRGFSVGSLSMPVDFAVAGSTIYVLDIASHMLTLVSPYSSFSNSITYEGFAKAATSLAATGTRIVFADTGKGTFQSVDDVIPATIVFEGGKLTSDLIKFYSYLNEQDLLASQEYHVRQDESLPSIYAHQQVLPLGYDKAIDKLICVMNEAICSAGMGPAAKPGDVIRIPRVKMEVFHSHRAVQIEAFHPDSEEMGDMGSRESHGTKNVAFVVEQLTGDRPDIHAEELRKLNPLYTGRGLLDEQKGTFEIPVTGVIAHSLLPSSSTVSSLKQKFQGDVTILLGVPQARAQSLGRIEGGPGPLQEMAVSAGPQLNSPDSADEGSDPFCTARPGEISRWLKAIRFCRPSQSTAVEIAVVDLSFNPDIPAFSDDHGAFTRYQPRSSDVHPIDLSGSMSDQATFDEERDHGDHVAALIGARKGPSETISVNPEARIAGIQLEDFVDALKESGYHIFNLSLGEKEYSAGSRPITSGELDQWIHEIIIDGTDLFVIAAGNDNQKIDGDRFSGLGQQDNVVIVMASNLPDQGEPNSKWTGPDPPPGQTRYGSNYGVQFVSLIAPGENILSALANGKWGLASGTSQATALVSGVASSLKALYSQLAAWQIKQRLITTTKLDPWMSGATSDWSTGGMLDMRAALYGADRLVAKLKDGRECTGRIPAPNRRDILILPRGAVAPRLEQIRRIHRTDEDGSYILFYTVTNDTTHRHEVFRSDPFFPPDVLVFSPRGVPSGQTISFYPDPGSCGEEAIDIADLVDLYNGFY